MTQPNHGLKNVSLSLHLEMISNHNELMFKELLQDLSLTLLWTLFVQENRAHIKDFGDFKKLVAADLDNDCGFLWKLKSHLILTTAVVTLKSTHYLRECL
jgi:hypothetical protein